MWRIVWFLAAVMLLTGCAGSAPRPAPAPVTQPKDPAAVYASMRPTLQYAAEDLVQARQVEFVAAHQFNPNSGYVLLNRPLWGDKNEQEIAHVLALLRQGGAQPTGCNVDRLLLVRPKFGADRCYDSAEAFGNQDLRGLLPPITPVTVEPTAAAPGQTITVRGEGWVGGGSTATLELQDGAGKVFRLGEAPMARGSFSWTGPLPAEGVTIPPWLHVNLLVTVTNVGTANGHLSLSWKR
jgi:hypothetical protein